MAVSKRQHFIAQFYQRNFADPMFSDNIRVYEAKTRSWNDKRRTPKGIGWFPHLYNVVAEDGHRTDAFERFLGKFIDGKAEAAMKKAAKEPDRLSNQQRDLIALFVGFAAARTPGIMHSTQEDSLAELPKERAKELDEMARDWCVSVGKSHNESSMREFLKPSLLNAVVSSALSMRKRLLQLQWYFVRTNANEPFITSDWPVFAEYDSSSDVRVVSFPLSSESALIATSLTLDNSQLKDALSVAAINRQTLSRAKEFLICRQTSFPADADLAEWPFSEA